jgi:galactokinase
MPQHDGPAQSGQPADGPETSSLESDTRLVWNPFLAEYTGQAPARMRRLELTDDCPFCADLTTGRVPPESQAWIRPNDFPALQPPNGECYLLIYSADHDRTFADLTVPEVVRIIGLWQRIYAELSPRYPCIMTWETSGEVIGQTQRHPHGQTYAVAIMPEMLGRELAAVERAESAGDVCPFCAEVRAESAGPRIVLEGAHWVGFIPAYARYPHQVRLTSRAHTSAITGIAEGEPMEELAAFLPRVIRAYNRAFQAPMPYMLALHQLADERFHLHVELLPVGRAPGKLKLAASCEMAWGFWMNDSFPEVKAAELRDYVRREEEERAVLEQLPTPAQRAVAAYREQFAPPTESEPLTVAWAPGRVNLIGEHTDYNDGYVLPVAVDRVVALAGQPHAGTTSRCYSVHHRQRHFFRSNRAALLAPDRRQRMPLWVRYVRGVLRELVASAATVQTPAFNAAIVGDVPVGGGMSSSAALDVAVATFAAALGGPRLSPLETALLCQRAEAASAGVHTGIMDQAIACLARADHALLLDCRSLSYEHIPVRLPGVVMAVFDTQVSRALASSGYNARRQQCEAATALLGRLVRADDASREIRALRDVTTDDLARYGARLPDPLLRRARHVVTENARVLAAAEALRAGDADRLGALLYASHASLRDDYEVSCLELDVVVEIAATVPGVLGARMMGAGFGGSTLILVHQDAFEGLRDALAAAYPARTGKRGELHRCQVSGGPESRVIALDKR